MRRTPIRSVSKKRRKENELRRRNILDRYGRFPRCAACEPLAAVGVTRSMTGCRGAAEDAHEPAMRSRGADITDPDQCIPVSRDCHAWIHSHPKIATQAGLLIPSSAGPRSIP
jgi:hypothetical protein